MPEYETTTTIVELHGKLPELGDRGACMEARNAGKARTAGTERK